MTLRKLTPEGRLVALVYHRAVTELLAARYGGEDRRARVIYRVVRAMEDLWPEETRAVRRSYGGGDEQDGPEAGHDAGGDVGGWGGGAVAAAGNGPGAGASGREDDAVGQDPSGQPVSRH